MRWISDMIFYALIAHSRTSMGRKSINRIIRGMQKSGYTKSVFDVGGYSVVIQSHNHVEDNSA